MVDINLIGDDKTGEEERVEDFTQSSSMDTQELAFEERTETFDTTKTTGFARRRSYSSLMSTLIIVAVLLLLGGAIYYLMFSGDEPATEAELQALVQDSQDFAEEPSGGQPEQVEPQADLGGQEQNGSQEGLAEQPVQPTSEVPPETKPTQTRPVEAPQPKAQPPVTREITLTSGDFLTNTRAAVDAVTTIVNSVPSGLSTTLLSYAGEQVRLELVANAVSDVREFADQLNQTSGGNLAIVSQDEVATDGTVLQKVLLFGQMPGNGRGGDRAQVQFMTLAQAKDWLTGSAQRFGLEVRQLTSQPGIVQRGSERIPILLRAYGPRAAVVDFLQDLAQQKLNFDIAKVLLVSPDMVSFRDDNLMLVMNMFLLQQ
ncbi:MAG: hypothetical protein D6743_12935 [Calditrichaeota bacterium]|nr:MAG: hypothetical protein D6743_12935 [Calditrichota bacterium]